MTITPTTPIGVTIETLPGQPIQVFLSIGDLLLPITRDQLKDLKQTILRADYKLWHHLTALDAMAPSPSVSKRRSTDFTPL